VCTASDAVRGKTAAGERTQPWLSACAGGERARADGVAGAGDSVRDTRGLAGSARLCGTGGLAGSAAWSAGLCRSGGADAFAEVGNTAAAGDLTSDLCGLAGSERICGTGAFPEGGNAAAGEEQRRLSAYASGERNEGDGTAADGGSMRDLCWLVVSEALCGTDVSDADEISGGNTAGGEVMR